MLSWSADLLTGVPRELCCRILPIPSFLGDGSLDLGGAQAEEYGGLQEACRGHTGRVFPERCRQAGDRLLAQLQRLRVPDV